MASDQVQGEGTNAQGVWHHATGENDHRESCMPLSCDYQLDVI